MPASRGCTRTSGDGVAMCCAPEPDRTWLCGFGWKRNLAYSWDIPGDMLLLTCYIKAFLGNDVAVIAQKHIAGGIRTYVIQNL
jgi:hypothetical protein